MAAQTQELLLSVIVDEQPFELHSVPDQPPEVPGQTFTEAYNRWFEHSLTGPDAVVAIAPPEPLPFERPEINLAPGQASALAHYAWFKSILSGPNAVAVVADGNFWQENGHMVCEVRGERRDLGPLTSA